jgi:hypothetical protein
MAPHYRRPVNKETDSLNEIQAAEPNYRRLSPGLLYLHPNESFIFRKAPQLLNPEKKDFINGEEIFFQNQWSAQILAAAGIQCTEETDINKEGA